MPGQGGQAAGINGAQSARAFIARPRGTNWSFCRIRQNHRQIHRGDQCWQDRFDDSVRQLICLATAPDRARWTLPSGSVFAVAAWGMFGILEFISHTGTGPAATRHSGRPD